MDNAKLEQKNGKWKMGNIQLEGCNDAAMVSGQKVAPRAKEGPMSMMAACWSLSEVKPWTHSRVDLAADLLVFGVRALALSVRASVLRTRAINMLALWVRPYGLVRVVGEGVRFVCGMGESLGPVEFVC